MALTGRLALRTAGAVLALAFGIAAAPAPAKPLPPMKSVTVHGQTIRYIEAGQGPDLVLVHGMGSSASFDWGHVIPSLSAHYHVLAMDQLGFGQSAKPLISYGIQTWVDMLDGFLKVRHVTRFMLAGESLGGWISALYTIEAESDHAMLLPTRLVLTDAAGHRSLLQAKAHPFSNALSLGGVRAGLGVLFHNHALITDAMVEQAFDTRLAEGNQFTQDSFWKNADAPDTFVDDRLGAITIPTLVVWGGDDHIVPIADGRDYAAKIKGARLSVIPDSGHGPAIERPDDYLRVVEPFLSSP